MTTVIDGAEIRRRLREGVGVRELARMYGVQPSTITYHRDRDLTVSEAVDEILSELHVPLVVPPSVAYGFLRELIRHAGTENLRLGLRAELEATEGSTTCDAS